MRYCKYKNVAPSQVRELKLDNFIAPDSHAGRTFTGA